MKKRHNGWNNYLKANARVSIGILLVLSFVGVIVLPSLVSSAQMIYQAGTGQYLPVVLKNDVVGSTSTMTPSATNTLSSAALTGTAKPTSTQTLTPSPTFTGTLVPIATLSVTVSGSPAKVNEGFTFTIKVGNTGTGPTHNNVVSDSFPTFIDVRTVSSTVGTVTKLTHSFTVAIGDVLPGEVVTITVTVRVNSTLTRTETLSNVVTLTYNTTSKTASATYKVVYQSLPGTGDLPINQRAGNITPVALVAGIISILLGVSFMLVIWWSRMSDHRSRLWLSLAGVFLILIGFISAVSGTGLFNSTEQLAGYAMTPTNVGALAQQQPIEPSATILPRRPASAFSTPDSYVPIVTLPDYPIPTPQVTITPQPGEPAPDTSAITRIVIPALMLDTIVKYVPFDGVTWMITGLRQEVAWMGDTSWPGLGSNTGLAGHVTVAGMGDGPFRHLEELPIGEVVLLYTEKNIYTYQVRENMITDDSDMSVILPTDNAQISLITCVDWDEENHLYLNRLVVFADLIRSEPVGIGMLP